MDREIKFRVWDKTRREMINSTNNHYISFSGGLFWQFGFDTFEPLSMQDFELMQYTGLKDNSGVVIYEGDILEFDNGDRLVIKCERWVEFYVDWIGDPRCEDQARDFYRIERAKLIGNIYESPELLEINNG